MCSTFYHRAGIPIRTVNLEQDINFYCSILLSFRRLIVVVTSVTALVNTVQLQSSGEQCYE